MNKHEYRIVDIHAHIFPDKIAEKATDAIGSYYGIKMRGTGTIEGLLVSGSKINVSSYVVHSSATVVDQVKAINNYVSDVVKSDRRLIGFGTVHPDLENPAAEVDRIISLGLSGIKLHPDFQHFNIDDESMMPIYKAAEGRLPILIHTGDRKKTSSSPKRLSKILTLFPDLTVIAAHFGGYSMWDESIRYLVGKKLYMDTSSSLSFIDPGKAVGIIRKHGVDKFVFGSDYPMWDHEKELMRFLKLDLTEEERKAILCENAEKLLNIRRPEGE